MNSYVDFQVLGNTFGLSLIAGVGITALFSVAVRALASEDEDSVPDTMHRLIAGGCLLLVAVAVTVGLWAVLAK